MPKDKSYKKRFYINAAKAQKLQTVNVLQPGLRGFLCTGEGREQDSIKEAYNILNEFADKEYGQEYKISEVSPSFIQILVSRFLYIF